MAIERMKAHIGREEDEKKTGGEELGRGRGKGVVADIRGRRASAHLPPSVRQ